MTGPCGGRFARARSAAAAVVAAALLSSGVAFAQASKPEAPAPQAPARPTAATARRPPAKPGPLPRGFVGGVVGMQLPGQDFVATAAFTLYAEEGRYDASFDAPSAPAFDVGGGARLWRRLGAAVAVSRVVADGPTAVTARMPHPFYFDRPRDIEGTLDGHRREETVLHASALWMTSLSTRTWLALTAGPSFFSVAQDVVSAVRARETYPYDRAEFGGATTSRRDETAVGVHVGGEVDYKIGKQWAIGGAVRYSRASVELAVDDDDRVSVTAGGVEMGGAIRWLF